MNGLFVGVSGIDMVYLLDKLPAADTKVRTSDYNIMVGGPALNAALACAKLGGSPTLMTGLGLHPLANIVRNVCREHGIHIIDIMPEKELPNVSFIAVDLEHSHRTIVSGQKETNPITLHSEHIFRNFDYCLYDCNLISYTQKLVHNLSLNNIPLILDCGSWKDNISYALEYADVAISSERFISPDGKDIFDLQLVNNIRYAAKTRGHKSLIYSENGEFGEVAVHKLDNVNTLGAGDAFHGAFCYYHYHTLNNFTDALTHSCEYVGKYLVENTNSLRSSLL